MIRQYPRTESEEEMSLCMRKPTIWVPTRSDTNLPVQSQEQARSLKIRIYQEEGMYYLCSKNKGADQLRSYCEADLRLCFCICRLLVFLSSGSNYFPGDHSTSQQKS